MKIIVTGASGFIGRQLCPLLEKEFPDAQIFQTSRVMDFSRIDYALDLKNSTSVAWMMDEIKPDVVVNLAANANACPNKDRPLSQIEDNLYSVLNLLECCQPTCHFIQASSIVVYGNSHAIRETGNIEADQCYPTSLYALSKTLAEEAIHRYDRLFKVRGCNLRFSAIVGSYEQMTHGMVKDIISKIKKPNNELNLIGKAPGAKKPFLHISDACNTILFAIKNQLSGAYNVAPNDNIFVEDVANLIMAKLGIFKKIVWDGSKVWTGDNPVLKCSHNKINLAGFKLEYESSEEAIIAALNESL